MQVPITLPRAFPSASSPEHRLIVFHGMVLLTITPAAKSAIDEYCRLHARDTDGESDEEYAKLQSAETGSPISHNTLIDISQYLVNHHKEDARSNEWRLEILLKGANVYQPPPPPKPQPTPEYKALMQRLREQEEQRQYERMLNPPAQPETFTQRFPRTAPYGSGIDLGHNAQDIVDDVTYADVNRQMVLIINVLISIICTSIAVWMAARRWSTPQRLGLSFSSSTVVAVAEVAIYMGYIKRIKDAKTKERKAAEKKEIVDTWVIDGKTTSQQIQSADTIRFRKGKHR